VRVEEKLIVFDS